MITVKIDIDKIDESKLFQGKKGRYLDLVLIPTPDSPYGDYMVKQSQTKEERAAGVQGIILGNARKVVPAGRAHRAVDAKPTRDDDVPF